MDDRLQVDAIYTDFSKAFDKISQSCCRDYSDVGIKDDLLRWFASYVKTRSQAVVVGGHKSDYITCA